MSPSRWATHTALPILLVLTACGLPSSGIGTRVNEERAQDVKAETRAQFGIAFEAALSTAGGTKARIDQKVRRSPCTEVSHRRFVTLGVQGWFAVRGSSPAVVAGAIKGPWRSRAWKIRPLRDGELIFRTAGSGVHRFVGSAVIRERRDGQGRQTTTVDVEVSSACIGLPESLMSSSWPES